MNILTTLKGTYKDIFYSNHSKLLTMCLEFYTISNKTKIEEYPYEGSAPLKKAIKLRLNKDKELIASNVGGELYGICCDVNIYTKTCSVLPFTESYLGYLFTQDDNIKSGDYLDFNQNGLIIKVDNSNFKIKALSDTLIFNIKSSLYGIDKDIKLVKVVFYGISEIPGAVLDIVEPDEEIDEEVDEIIDEEDGGDQMPDVDEQPAPPPLQPAPAPEPEQEIVPEELPVAPPIEENGDKDKEVVVPEPPEEKHEEEVPLPPKEAEPPKVVVPEEPKKEDQQPPVVPEKPAAPKPPKRPLTPEEKNYRRLEDQERTALELFVEAMGAESKNQLLKLPILKVKMFLTHLHNEMVSCGGAFIDAHASRSGLGQTVKEHFGKQGLNVKALERFIKLPPSPCYVANFDIEELVKQKEEEERKKKEGGGS